MSALCHTFFNSPVFPRTLTGRVTILFEALFILTTVDAGTRVARFMIQDLLGVFVPAMQKTESWAANLVATGLAVSGWGYFLYQGVTDPLGGVNTLWPLFGISNQMLAAIALTLCTVVLFKMKRQRFAWVTIGPAVWLAICTLTAGWQKLFDANPAIGFLAHRSVFAEALARGQVLGPAKSVADMNAIITNDAVEAARRGGLHAGLWRHGSASMAARAASSAAAECRLDDGGTRRLASCAATALFSYAGQSSSPPNE